MSAETLEKLRAGGLPGMRRLDLSAGLTEVPPEVLTLADSLEILNLSGNQLTDLPEWLPRLTKLRVLFCSENPFRQVPEVVGKCGALTMAGFKSCRIETLTAAALPPGLRWLILTDNLLTDLPEELGARMALQKLMLSGNRLTTLPGSMAALRNLELLRLASNRFTSLPAWLPDLPRLAWLAIAGNPLTKVEHKESPEFPQIPWQNLELQERLGQGASGEIFSAHWNGQGQDGEQSEVAVKLFKGAMTSDGLPDSEMAASLAAAGHPGLIGAIGKISGHPEDVSGLVMRRISPRFRPLAGPPSLESCTRDIYPDDFSLTADEILGISGGIAEAGAFLHGRQLLHGDLYAHNILQAPGGEALLGDFGAACSTTGLSAEQEIAVQRLEVLAFGILLEELLARSAGPLETAAMVRLRSLQSICGVPDPSQRPDFPAIAETISGIRE